MIEDGYVKSFCWRTVIEDGEGLNKSTAMALEEWESLLELWIGTGGSYPVISKEEGGSGLVSLSNCKRIGKMGLG